MQVYGEQSLNPEILRPAPEVADIAQELLQAETAETYYDPVFVQQCESILFFFADKPNFTFSQSGAGIAIRQSVGLETAAWTKAAAELMKVSGAMASVKSEAAQKSRSPNDTFFIRPDTILAGGYPYFTPELQAMISARLESAEKDN